MPHRSMDAPPTGMAGKGFPSYGGRVKAKCRDKDASSGQGCPSYGVDDGGKGIFTIHYLGDIGYMLNWKKPTWKHLFIFLLILHVAPLWVFTYFPTQDGPSHIYNALTLIEHHKHENYTMRDIWKLNITIFPNWMSHIILALLLYIFPPLITEKILVTLTVGLVPISFVYFLNAVHKRGYLFCWLGFIFSYNYLLFMGFYNFALSISFFFFSFGYWWRHREDLRVNHLIVLYLLLLVTYLCHIVSYGLVLLGISVAAGCLWGSKAIATAWKERKNDGSPTSTFSRFIGELKPLIRFGGYMVPAYFILMEYYLQSMKLHQIGNHRGMEWIAEYFWGVKSIVYFTDWHIPVNQVLLGVLGAATLVSLLYRIRRRQWLLRSDLFLPIAILFTIMFIRAPWSYGPGGWINDRIHLYILLVLAAWIVPDMGKVFRYGFTAALVAITLLHFGRTAYDHAHLSPEMAEEVSGVKLIEPHTTFTARSPNWSKSDSLGPVKYVAPFLHTVAFYGLYADDVGHLNNYEANYYYFPVNKFNTSVYPGREDYVVAWAYPADEKFADLTPNYDLIHETKNLKLFRRKRNENLDLSVWDETADNRLIIRFDMQPDNAETAEGYHAIGRNIEYISGKFGWVTQSPGPSDPLAGIIHNDGQGSKGIVPHARDCVWDTHDAAFKLALPNGKYRVINYFCSAENAAHQVNLLANGKRVIEKLLVPAGEEIIEHSYTMDVTTGALTQVIYRPKKRVSPKGKHNHWVWSGFTVEQLPATEAEQ